MKKVYLFLLGSVLSLPALAQPKIMLRLAFNAEQNRYEVFARPNFSAKGFSWGPSQVSVVLPGDVADESISTRSTNVGIWADNSTVFQPKASPKVDFHGFTTQGGKVDLIAGDEYLLFDFTLKQGFVEGIRLFENKVDPTSTQEGMKGGDFASYMADEKGHNYLDMDRSVPSLGVKEEAVLLSKAGAALKTAGSDASIRVVAYPNPSPTGTFRMYLKGFEKDEVVSVQFSTLSGKTLNSFKEKVEALAGRAISAPGTSDAFFLVTVTRPEKQQTFAQKVWLRD